MWCHRAICRKFSSIGQSHKFWGQSNAAEVHGFNRPAKLEQAHTLSEHTGPYPSYYKHTLHTVDATSHPQHSHALLVSTSQREHCRTQQHTHQKDGRAAGLHNERKDMRSGTQHTMPKHTQGFKPHQTAHPLRSEATQQQSCIINHSLITAPQRASRTHNEPTTPAHIHAAPAGAWQQTAHTTHGHSHGTRISLLLVQAKCSRTPTCKSELLQSGGCKQGASAARKSPAVQYICTHTTQTTQTLHPTTLNAITALIPDGYGSRNVPRLLPSECKAKKQLEGHTLGTRTCSHAHRKV